MSRKFTAKMSNGTRRGLKESCRKVVPSDEVYEPAVPDHPALVVVRNKANALYKEIECLEKKAKVWKIWYPNNDRPCGCKDYGDYYPVHRDDCIVSELERADFDVELLSEIFDPDVSFPVHCPMTARGQGGSKRDSSNWKHSPTTHRDDKRIESKKRRGAKRMRDLEL
jgi:hypothetical protein